MTSNRPAIIPEGRYSQREAAQLLGVNRHTLRNWEKNPAFTLPAYRRKTGKGKFYKGRDLLRIWEDHY